MGKATEESPACFSLVFKAKSMALFTCHGKLSYHICQFSYWPHEGNEECILIWSLEVKKRAQIIWIVDETRDMLTKSPIVFTNTKLSFSKKSPLTPRWVVLQPLFPTLSCLMLPLENMAQFRGPNKLHGTSLFSIFLTNTNKFSTYPWAHREVGTCSNLGKDFDGEMQTFPPEDV